MKGTIDGELATVISSVSLACKQIASLVNRAGISNLTGVAGNQNVQVRSLRSQGFCSGRLSPGVIRAWITRGRGCQRSARGEGLFHHSH